MSFWDRRDTAIKRFYNCPKPTEAWWTLTRCHVWWSEDTGKAYAEEPVEGGPAQDSVCVSFHSQRVAIGLPGFNEEEMEKKYGQKRSNAVGGTSSLGDTPERYRWTGHGR